MSLEENFDTLFDKYTSGFSTFLNTSYFHFKEQIVPFLIDAEKQSYYCDVIGHRVIVDIDEFVKDRIFPFNKIIDSHPIANKYCDKFLEHSKVQRLVNEIIDNNAPQWLGFGISFFVNDLDMAIFYAQEVLRRNKHSNPWLPIALMKAKINVGICLDLTQVSPLFFDMILDWIMMYENDEEWKEYRKEKGIPSINSLLDEVCKKNYIRCSPLERTHAVDALILTFLENFQKLLFENHEVPLTDLRGLIDTILAPLHEPCLVYFPRLWTQILMKQSDVIGCPIGQEKCKNKEKYTQGHNAGKKTAKAPSFNDSSFLSQALGYLEIKLTRNYIKKFLSY